MKKTSILFMSGLFLYLHATWQSIGPYGGSCAGLNIIPDSAGSIFLINFSNPNKIFRSQNNGASWEMVGKIPCISYYSLTVSPNDPKYIYAGNDAYNYYDSIFVTTNGGLSWDQRSISDGQGFDNILLVHPNIPTTVFGLGYRIRGSQNVITLYRSTDAGKNWNWSYVDTIPGSDGGALCLDPVNPNIMYAGGHRNYKAVVYRSTDGGITFADASTGFSPKLSFITTLVINPLNGNMLYAGSDSGIYRSTDSGLSWSRGSGAYKMIYGLAIAHSDPNILYAAADSFVYKSTNAGLTWSVLNSTIVAYAGLAVKRDDPNVVWAAWGDGVYKTTNGGMSWYQSNTGINALYITGFAIAPSNADIIYTSGFSYYDLFKTSDAGETWRSLPQIPRKTGMLAALCVHNHETGICLGLTAYC